MACEKQMPPLAALVFHGAHYIKNTYLNYIFNIMSHLLLNHLNHDFLDAIYYAYYTIPNLGAE